MGHDGKPQFSHETRRIDGSSCVTSKPLATKRPFPGKSALEFCDTSTTSSSSSSSSSSTTTTKLVTNDPIVTFSPTSPVQSYPNEVCRATTTTTTTAIERGNLSSPFRCSSVRKLCRCELRRHATRENCWLLVNGKVYDVTTIISVHPGGPDSILRKAGGAMDCAPDMQFHSSLARNVLDKCLLGTLQPCDGHGHGDADRATTIKKQPPSRDFCVLQDFCTLM